MSNLVSPKTKPAIFSPRRVLLAGLLGSAVLVPASQAVAAPSLTVSSAHSPAQFARRETGRHYDLTVTNTGPDATSGTLTLKDTLPPGLTAQSISGAGWVCSRATLTCTNGTSFNPGDASTVTLTVVVGDDAPSSVTNVVGVSGGGAEDASAEDATPIGPAPLFDVTNFSARAVDENGDDDTRAGGHPYAATTAIDFSTIFRESDLPAGGGVKDISVDLPAGFVGNAQAVPQCSLPDLVDLSCPDSTQVGTVTLFANSDATGVTPSVVNVYNLVPEADRPAEFGFLGLGSIPVVLTAHVRPAPDYRLTVTSKDISAGLWVVGVSMTFWGTPADPRHDTERGLSPFGDSCAQENINTGTTSCSNSAATPLRPFLTNPTECSGHNPVTTVRADGWDHPDVLLTKTAESPLVTGCNRLAFNPSLSLQPDTTQMDSPAGYAVNLKVPQTNDPNTLATSALKDVTVKLPEGVNVSPSASDGLQGCSDAQFALTSLDAATCPDGSKIGTVEVTTPLLPGPLKGQVFLGTPKCAINVCTQEEIDAGKMFRLFLQVQGFDLRVKIPGYAVPDKTTGELTSTFKNNPQLPFSDLSLKFKSGPRAPLANPMSCGEMKTATSFTGWSGATSDVTHAFKIDSDGKGGACPGTLPFSPALTAAGTTNPIGGANTSFTLRVDRADGQQIMDGLTVELPTGLLASVKDVPLCSDADANAGTCPAASRVGTATAGSGPGSHPYFLSGPVSLTGAYKGAPYGLAVAIRAVAGPFDLGTVVVRQAAYVDPKDAHLTVVSDPLPTILSGVPLRLRTIQVDVDRPNFMVNPTSCAQKAIKTTLHSQQGATAALSSRFQAGACAALKFTPKIAIKLTNRSQTKDGKHPGLESVVTSGPGQANLKKVKVALPLSMALDPENANALCEFADGLKVNCPKSSEVGTVEAISPLLKRPLYGKVYFVKNVRFNKKGQPIRTLPTLLIPMRGEIALDVRATSDVDKTNRLVTTFDLLPDAAISKFTLKLNGGKHGILVVTHKQNICKGRQIASVESDAQNGKTDDFSVKMATPCKKASSKKARSKRTKRAVTKAGAHR